MDAADGGLVATQGPSWRMIAAWTGPGSGTAQGIYPGGQSENPASPWYEDQVADWWNGRYLPMPPPGSSHGGDPVDPAPLTPARPAESPLSPARLPQPRTPARGCDIGGVGTAWLSTHAPGRRLRWLDGGWAAPGDGGRVPCLT